MAELDDLQVSVVVPVYNSANTLDELVSRLNNVLTDTVNDYEIILVNDGSKDDSWKVISALAKKHNNLKGLNLMRNYGQHNALLCGIRRATYPLTVTLDDDLQNPPEEIPKILSALNDKYDLVYGYPREIKFGIWRRFSSIVTKFIISRIVGRKILQSISSFRAFRTNIRDVFADYSGYYVSLDILLLRDIEKISSISVEHRVRGVGKSNYNFRKLVLHTLNMLFSCSIIPLRFASILGLVIAFFGFITLLYVVIHYLFIEQVIPGFTFLASLISIFSGTQLLALGIMGEYLGRVHFRLAEFKTYFVKETLNFDKSGKLTHD